MVVVIVVPEFCVAAKKIRSPARRSADVVTVTLVGPTVFAFLLSEASNEITPVVASIL